MDKPERERDLHRLLAFVDAIVAIAITLLILPLTSLGPVYREGTVANLLLEHADDLVGFFLSFAVIAASWVGQHLIVRPLIRQSPAVIWLLLAWALTIVFLPFPTTLVASSGASPLVKLLYIGTMATGSALLAAVAWTIGKDRNLRDTDEKPDMLGPVANVVLFILALVVSLAIPRVGYWSLLVLFLSGVVENGLRRTVATRS